MKQLDAKEIDPSLLYIRKLRGRSINGESNTPHIIQPSPGPSCVQSINYNPTATNDSLPTYLCHSTLEATSSISAQSSPELDTDQGDVIDETIKCVTHKLNQTILTPDIGIINSEMTPHAGNTKTMNTPNVDDIRTKTIADNPLHNSTTDFQLPRNVSLHPTNTDSNINATHIKVSQSPRENITIAFTM